MAALTRHWSTWFNGIQLDEASFRREIRRMVRSARRAAASGKRPPRPIEPVDAASALRDMRQSLGFVPSFMRKFPKVALAGAWRELRDVELNPTTALPPQAPEPDRPGGRLPGPLQVLRRRRHRVRQAGRRHLGRDRRSDHHRLGGPPLEHPAQRSSGRPGALPPRHRPTGPRRQGGPQARAPALARRFPPTGRAVPRAARQRIAPWVGTWRGSGRVISGLGRPLNSE